MTEAIDSMTKLNDFCDLAYTISKVTKEKANPLADRS